MNENNNSNSNQAKQQEEVENEERNRENLGQNIQVEGLEFLESDIKIVYTRRNDTVNELLYAVYSKNLTDNKESEII